VAKTWWGGENALKEIPYVYSRNGPRFKMWNLIMKYMTCSCMIEYIQTINPLLNIFVSLGGLKKNQIPRQSKLLVYLIIKTICLGGIWVPQEEAFQTPRDNISSFFRGNKTYKVEPETLRCLTKGMWPYHIS